MLILLVLLLLILGSSGGYYGHRRWGYGGGAGVGLSTILVVLLVIYMLGFLTKAEERPGVLGAVAKEDWRVIRNLHSRLPALRGKDPS